MGREPSITAETALLRVLINGQCESSEIIRKVRDWTEGAVDLDQAAFETAIADLQNKALVEEKTDVSTDKRGGQSRHTYVLTPDGQAAAMEILAASLTRKS